MGYEKALKTLRGERDLHLATHSHELDAKVSFWQLENILKALAEREVCSRCQGRGFITNYEEDEDGFSAGIYNSPCPKCQSKDKPDQPKDMSLSEGMKESPLYTIFHDASEDIYTKKDGAPILNKPLWEIPKDPEGDKLMVESLKAGWVLKDTRKKRALEGSKKHWDEVCVKAAKGILTIGDLSASKCACCDEYNDGEWDAPCRGCPLSNPQENNLYWCCGGRFRRAYETLSLQACEAVRDYIKQKLEELEPFGVGDIVKLPGGDVGQVMDVLAGGDVSVQFKDKYYKHVQKRLLARIFPTHLVPKELDGIKCEPKGDVVRFEGGTVGMVTAIDNDRTHGPISALCWYPNQTDGVNFINTFRYRSEIEEVIWSEGA